MAYEALQLELSRDNVLRITHPSLPSVPLSSLSAANLAGATALTVRDNAAFAAALGGDLLLIGNLGDDRAEIVYVNGAITPGTSVTTTALIYPHPTGTPVHKIIYDKIKVYGNTSAAASGSTLIDTIGIDVTSPYTEYIVTGATYAYYGAKGNRSIATTYDGPLNDSSFIAAAGWLFDQLGFVIDKAFKAVGERVRPDGVFSLQWAYDMIYLAEQDITRMLKRASWNQAFDTNLGDITPGQRRVALPSDIDDPNTTKSLNGFRLGTDINMSSISKSEYEDRMRSVAYATITNTALAGATTLVLSDTSDFTDSGSIDVYTGGAGPVSIAYTANNRTTNTISGLVVPVGGVTQADNVYQNESHGAPVDYSIWQGYLYFGIIPDTTVTQRDMWIDYYKRMTRSSINSAVIVTPDPYAVQLFLECMIRKHKSGGNLAKDDPAWLLYMERRARIVTNEISGQRTLLVPQIPDSYSVSAGAWDY